jgi:hypothetical protein
LRKQVREQAGERVMKSRGIQDVEFNDRIPR